MSDNAERTAKPGEDATVDPRSGVTRDVGPYVAQVIGHVDGTRMGELQVFIPEFGDKNSAGAPITAKYCSPFYGKTYGTDTQLAPPGPWTSGQSYGMWMVPPDIGCKVLVIFAKGDKSDAYWIGCVYDSSSHHMVPALGRNVGGPNNTRTVNDSLSASISSDSVLPVVEFTTGSQTAFSPDGLNGTPRYPHEYQAGYLVSQGLDRDKIRGAISSSSMRESPSNVYGISTPGPRIGDKDQIPGSPGKVVTRKGGHQFVMDDGAADGSDQLIRLRTSAGHQILMNDTAEENGVLYIASASGMQWMEFSSDGSINMYGIAGFNVRSKGALNFHSDSAVNIHSGGAVKINGDFGVNITSLATVTMSGLIGATVRTDGILNLTGLGKADLSSIGPMTVGSLSTTAITGVTSLLLNSGGVPKPIPAIPTIPNALPDVAWGGTNWVYTPGALNSVCTVAPAHEPWIDPSTKLRPTPSKGPGLLVGIGLGAAASVAGGAAGAFFS